MYVAPKGGININNYYSFPPSHTYLSTTTTPLNHLLAHSPTCRLQLNLLRRPGTLNPNLNPNPNPNQARFYNSSELSHIDQLDVALLWPPQAQIYIDR